jgi:hypothetical protein
MSDATKACPYCGEQILAVAIKCKHCGSALGDSSGPAGAVKKQFMMRPTFAVLLVLIVALFAAAWIYNLNRTGSITGKAFSDADVSNIERSIRGEFEKQRGVTVEDVKMLRESPRKLSGFAKIRVPLLGAVNKAAAPRWGMTASPFGGASSRINRGA